VFFRRASLWFWLVVLVPSNEKIFFRSALIAVQHSAFCFFFFFFFILVLSLLPAWRQRRTALVGFCVWTLPSACLSSADGLGFFPYRLLPSS